MFHDPSTAPTTPLYAPPTPSPVQNLGVVTTPTPPGLTPMCPIVLTSSQPSFLNYPSSSIFFNFLPFFYELPFLRLLCLSAIPQLPISLRLSLFPNMSVYFRLSCANGFILINRELSSHGNHSKTHRSRHVFLWA